MLFIIQDSSFRIALLFVHVADRVVQCPAFQQQAEEEMPAPEKQQDGFEPAAHVVEGFERAQSRIAADNRERKS